MINKNYRIIGASLLLVHPLIEAAPTLKMHVFEEKAQVESVVSSQTPQLKMHVFDSSEALKNNAVVAERYTRPKEEGSNKIAFPYVTAESYIKTGYRQDDLDWSIAGLNGAPNILSELKWRDIEIATLNVGTTLFFDSNWLINLDLLYGVIYDGDNQDSDYLGYNRTYEFSRSNNSADEGSVLDISASAGYSWVIPFNKQSTYPNIELRPEVGFSYYSQNFKMTDGNQTVSNYGFGVPVGEFAGLNSSYDATWFGPWVGLNSTLSFSEFFSLGWNLEYHYAEYESSANWNLRSDLAHPESFSNAADGYGLIGDIEGEFKLKPNLSLNLALKYQDWQAHDNGVKKTYTSDGRTLTSPFNGVNWKSFGANIGIVYDF